jgi:exosortase
MLIGLLYSRVLASMAYDWWSDPGLSQGFLIPPLAAYIAWIRRAGTLAFPAIPDSRGLLAIGLSAAVLIIGMLGAEFFLMRMSFVILLAGLVWSEWGYSRLRSLALPFFLLITMIPLPRVVYDSLTTPLRLLASDIAASVARALGVAVFRDGNVIALANVTLGVEEACSGLSSLSSLEVGGALLGFLVCTRLRSRLLLITLAIPLAIWANVVRIAGTALLADAHPEFAMGFYHAFSGWLMFVSAFFALYAIARVLHAFVDQ